MDQTIDLEEYLRTAGLSVNEREAQRQVAADLLPLLRLQTIQLKAHPYNPKFWLDRANTLHSLTYAELAMSDAWKAQHILDTLVESRAASRGCRLGWNCAFWLLDEHPAGETEAEELDVVVASTQEELASFQSGAVNFDNETLSHYRPRQYPWLSRRHQERNEQVLEQINMDLIATQPSSVSGLPYCEVRHAFELPELTTPKDSCRSFGIFAKTAIMRGTLVLKDASRLYGYSHRQLESWQHKGHDLLFMSELPLHKRAHTLLKVKCLLESVAAGVHPLDLPALALLRASYHSREQQTLELSSDVVAVNTALIQAGIDVLADHRYDAWVLLTIEARLANNLWSAPGICCLSPSFAMLNHSCAPNMHWKGRLDGMSCVEVTALTDIEPGEQLFIMYDAYVAEAVVEDRQKAMARWIDGGCSCIRCQFELKMNCSRAIEPTWSDGGVDDVSISW